MLRGQGPSWKIRSLDDFIARPLRYLRPKEILIDFQAPKTGYYLKALLILRAKLFDVCSALELVQAQPNRSLRLHFSDPWARSGCGPNTPFWENRPCYNRVKKDDVRRWYRRNGDHNLEMRITEKRELFLFFYEMILTPFCMHWAWRNATVTFDREPKLKSTSFTTSIKIADRKSTIYLGFRALLLTTWAYNEQLMDAGEMNRSEEASAPDFEEYDAISSEWTVQKSHHKMWKKALERYLNFAIATSEDFTNVIMNVSWPQMRQLLFTIWYGGILSQRNAFSEEHPGLTIEAGYDGLEVGHWTWNHDIIRRRYWEWCQNQHHIFEEGNIDLPSDSSSDAEVNFPDEEFEPFYLKFKSLPNWGWRSGGAWSGRAFLNEG
jgi:hypothetical protein